MTIGNTDYKAGPFTSGGGAGENEFTFEFRVFSEDDVRVVERDENGNEQDLELDSEYTVELNEDQDTDPGGTVTTVDSYPDDGRTITLISNVGQLQETQLPTAGPYQARTVERMIDRLTTLVHGLRGKLERAIVFPITDPLGFSVELPSAEARANRSIGFDNDGNLLIGGNFVGEGIAVSAFMETVLDDATADGALATLGFTSLTRSLRTETTESAYLSALGVSAFAQTILDDANASAVLSTLGVSAFGKTLLDDADSDAVLATLNFSAFGIALSQAADAAEIAALVLGEAGSVGAELFASDTLTAAYDALGISSYFRQAIGEDDPETFWDNLAVTFIYVSGFLTATGAEEAAGYLGIDAFSHGVLASTTADEFRNAIGITSPAPNGVLGGLRLTNDAGDATNDIGIGVGIASDSEEEILMRLDSALIKQLDALWAVGTNAGMRDGGAIANGTWHIFLIRRPDTGVVDVLASTSATSPTMPANYTQRRRIGSILREGGSIVQFTQYQDLFIRAVPAVDVNIAALLNTRVLATLSVPTGIIVRAQCRFIVTRGSSDNYGLVSEVAETDAAPSATATPLCNMAVGSVSDRSSGQMEVNTNSSGQIAYRFANADGSGSFALATSGWIDNRGRGIS